MLRNRNRRPTSLVFVLLPLLFAPTLLLAQTGTVTGRVTQQSETGAGGALAEVRVTVAGTSLFTLTGNDGRYTLKNVPEGQQTLSFRWIGYQPVEAKVTVVAGQSTTADVVLSQAPVSIGELVVEGASRAPERTRPSSARRGAMWTRSISSPVATAASSYSATVDRRRAAPITRPRATGRNSTIVSDAGQGRDAARRKRT